jgi:FkbM family methyltransferase
MTASKLKTWETSPGASRDEDPFISYSLNFEDVILHRLFPVNRTGFYVDVGAGHPRFENDTFSLYQRGWRGINIEPNHGFHAALIEERHRDINLRVVLSDSVGGTLTYYELNGSGLSTCDAKQAAVYQASDRDVVLREVPVTTLANVIAEAGIDRINILKIDVEGFEEKVLNGNDWERFRPDVVVVEATYPESPIRRPTKILSAMEQRGYRHVHFDGLNDFFLEHEFAAPEGLALPPNVFDRFVPHQIVDLRSQVESLRTNSTAAEEYTLSLRTHLDEALREIADLRSQVESLRTNSTASEEYALSLQTHLDEALREIADLRSQVESLRTNFTAAEEYTLSLRTHLDEALRAADALAVENRRIGHQTAHLTSENRRLYRAGEQMRTELLFLNQLLEPLHAMAEKMEQQRRCHENELAGAKNELAGAKNELAGAKNELAGAKNELAGARNELASVKNELAGAKNELAGARNELASVKNELTFANARLASAYLSRCWRLTAPLRWCDGIQRRILTRLRNGHGGNY